MTLRWFPDRRASLPIPYQVVDQRVADAPFGMRSTAGKIFGAIGGVMEAAIRSAYFSLTGKELKELKVQEMRGLDGIKEAKIKIGDLEVGVAVASSWSWRTLGGTHRLRLNLFSDGKRRAIEAGTITLPAATGWLLGLGATLAGLLALLAVVLGLRYRCPREEPSLLAAVHDLIGRGLSAQRAVVELTRSFPERLAGLTATDPAWLSHPRYRAAMLADVLAGESPAGVALPGSTVVISAVRKGDQPGESADVEVLVGWCAGAPVRRSDPPGGRANGQAVAKVEDHKRTRRPRKSVPARSGWRGSRARRALDSWAKAIVVGEEYIWERAAGENSGGVEGGMFGKSGQRKHGTTRGSPRRSRTAKALRITGTAGKSRRACEWGGWGRLSDDGAGQNNPNRSEGPWGRAACAARMAASNRAGFLDSDRGFGAATEDANVGSKPEHGQGMPGVGLTCTDKGEGPDGKASLGAVLGKTRRTES